MDCCGPTAAGAPVSRRTAAVGHARDPHSKRRMQPLCKAFHASMGPADIHDMIGATKGRSAACHLKVAARPLRVPPGRLGRVVVVPPVPCSLLRHSYLNNPPAAIDEAGHRCGAAAVRVEEQSPRHCVW